VVFPEENKKNNALYEGTNSTTCLRGCCRSTIRAKCAEPITYMCRFRGGDRCDLLGCSPSRALRCSTRRFLPDYKRGESGAPTPVHQTISPHAIHMFSSSLYVPTNSGVVAGGSKTNSLVIWTAREKADSHVEDIHTALPYFCTFRPGQPPFDRHIQFVGAAMQFMKLFKVAPGVGVRLDVRFGPPGPRSVQKILNY
jgi:hypothetical protein